MGKGLKAIIYYRGEHRCRYIDILITIILLLLLLLLIFFYDEDGSDILYVFI